MSINIINTMDIGNGNMATDKTLIRLVDIDGVRHLQMQGRSHAIMPATWSNGIIMTCPNNLDLDTVANSADTYYAGYGDGCELLEDIPNCLTMED